MTNKLLAAALLAAVPSLSLAQMLLLEPDAAGADRRRDQRYEFRAGS